MHVRWPRVAEVTPVAAHNHDPYGDEDLEGCPLEWDSQNAYISQGDLAGLGLITDAAQQNQGSYWPNEPPVLAPSGFYWYDYGPVGQGMHFWKTLPVGQRPSAEEQKAELEKHRQAFAWGRIPEGLEEALAQHGLSLGPDRPSFVDRNAKAIAVSLVVVGAIGLLFRSRASKR